MRSRLSRRGFLGMALAGVLSVHARMVGIPTEPVAERWEPKEMLGFYWYPELNHEEDLSTEVVRAAARAYARHIDDLILHHARGRMTDEQARKRSIAKKGLR